MNGVRYILKRPTLSAEMTLTDEGLENLLSKKYADDKEYINDICANSDLIVKQNLDGREVFYEVSSPSGLSVIPHMFSDTNTTITTDVNGYLISISAGETDKSLDVIKAAAGLAGKVAVPGTQESSVPRICPLFFEKDELNDYLNYVNQHLSLHRKKIELQNRISDIRLEIQDSSPEKINILSDTVNFLNDELNRTKQDLKEAGYKITKNKYNIYVADAYPIADNIYNIREYLVKEDGAVSNCSSMSYDLKYSGNDQPILTIRNKTNSSICPPDLSKKIKIILYKGLNIT